MTDNTEPTTETERAENHYATETTKTGGDSPSEPGGPNSSRSWSRHASAALRPTS